MRTRTILIAALTLIMLACPAAAQGKGKGGGVEGRDYEAAKAAEIAAVRLQLASRSGVGALQELADAETLLRRLKETRAPDLRRKLVAELDMALTRLHVAADGAGTPGGW
ncbi:MAG: hypothetical protein H7840_11500 [Alphaproteobacteria bacterium]